MKPMTWIAALAALTVLAGCGGGGGGGGDTNPPVTDMLTGTLKTDGGTAVVGVQIAILKTDGSVVIATSNSSGQIAMDIPTNARGFVVNAMPVAGGSYYPIFTYGGKTFQLSISSSADYSKLPELFILTIPPSKDISGLTFYNTSTPPPPPSSTDYIWPTSGT